MMVGLYATKIQAQVMRERKDIEDLYDQYPDTTFFWCIVDLVGSSNYRLLHGPKEGYVRGQTFFSLAATAIAPSPEVRLLKEIGDAVLICAPTCRPLLEVVCLMAQAARQLAAVAGSEQFPFAIRAGIDFGPAKRLSRGHEDFLGAPIDRLSRIMSVRSEACNVLISEDAFQPSGDIIREYPFIAYSDPIMLAQEKAKGLLRPVYYREVIIDWHRLVEFREHFVPWRQTGKT